MRPPTRRQDAQRGEQRQQHDARQQRAIVADVLEIEGDDEQQAQGGEVHRTGHAVSGDERGTAQQGQGKQRVTRAALGDDEPGGGGQCAPGRDDDGHGRAAVPGRNEGKGHADQRQRPQSRAWKIEPSRRGSAALGHDARSGQRRDRDDRHVEEEHPAPPGALDQQPAEQRPGGQRAAADAGPHPDGPSALALVRVGVGDDRERPGEHEGGAEPLNDPARDQHRRRTRRATAQRGDAEHGEAGEHDALVAVQVTDGPSGEHETGQREGVAVDDPLQPADPGVQAAADRRERHVDDRHVEQDQEVADAHDQQHRPTRGSGAAAVSTDRHDA